MSPKVPLVLGERGAELVRVDEYTVPRVLHLVVLHDGRDTEAHVADAVHEDLDVVFDAVGVQGEEELVDDAEQGDADAEGGYVGDGDLVGDGVYPVEVFDENGTEMP